MKVSDIQAGVQAVQGTAAVLAPHSGSMTLRERFRRTMFYQDVALRPNFEFGYWDQTLLVWHRQGLPATVTDEASAYAYFGIENWEMLPVKPEPVGVFEHTVLEETADRILYRDEFGAVAEINKHGDRSIPHFLSHGVTDRASWAPFREALDPDAPERWVGFEDRLAVLRNSPAPVGVNAGSLAGIPRNLMGFERYATLPYEDPAWFEEITEAFALCALGVLERVLPRMQVDFAHGWEDICFNGGPIINPDIYRAVQGPWMRRIADILTAHGVTIYSTDTDGNINPLVPIFLDNGLNTMFPVEVHAGSDPCAIRDRYGKHVRIWGGVDKRALITSPTAIDRALERLRPYVDQGGFIPMVDHRVPADVPLAHYLHYLDRKRAWFGVGGEPRY